MPLYFSVHRTSELEDRTEGQKERVSARRRVVQQVGWGVAASAIALIASSKIAVAKPLVKVFDTTISNTSNTIGSSAARVKQSQTGQTLTFDQLMDIGYRASKQGDLNTALINFRRALAIRPGQPYAAAAADNMAYYIQHERMTERRRAINQLESRLTRAQAQKDWVCAATTLDQLTTYTEPNSLNRERLIGQRGEVSGLLDARIDSDRWSTVCAAQNPVY